MSVFGANGTRLAILAVAMIGATGCEELNSFRYNHANRGAPTTWEAEPATVPLLEGDNGGLSIPVSIDEGPELAFRLDSRAPGIVVASDTAFDGKIRRPGGSVTIDTPGQRWSGRSVDRVSLRLGDLVLDEHTVLIASQPAVSADGLIGYDLLRRAVLEVDRAESRLVLHRPRAFRSPRRAAVAPLIVVDRMPLIDVGLVLPDGGRDYVRLVLDLGLDEDLLLTPGSAGRLGLSEGDRLDLLAGGVTFPLISVAVRPPDETLVDGRLGPGALSGRVFSVDLPAGFLWIHPPGGTPQVPWEE